MAEATLQIRRGIGQEAEYGGVDWRAVRIAEVASRAMTCAEVWFVVEDEDYEQRCDQENTFIHQNRVAPIMDRTLIIDERDDTAWIWFRDDIEDYDAFANRARAVGFYIFTLYPEPDIVDSFLQMEDNKLREAVDE